MGIGIGRIDLWNAVRCAYCLATVMLCGCLGESESSLSRMDVESAGDVAGASPGMDSSNMSETAVEVREASPGEGGTREAQAMRRMVVDLGVSPVTSIGAEEAGPASNLYRVRAVAQGASGQLFIAEPRRVLVYTDDGEYVQTMGGEGMGPGEFQGVTWVNVLRDDSLAVYDGALRRLSVFSPDGQLSRTMTVSNVSMRPLGLLGDGSVVARLGRQRRPLPANQVIARDSFELVRLDARGAVTNSIGMVPDQAFFEVISQGRATLGLYLQLPRTTVTMSQDQVFVVTGDDFEVRRFTLDGVEIVPWKFDHERVRVRGEDVMQFLNGMQPGVNPKAS